MSGKFSLGYVISGYVWLGHVGPR